MTRRQTITTAFLGIFWTTAMIWWDANHGLPKVALWTVCGVLFTITWVWCMKRWGGWKA